MSSIRVIQSTSDSACPVLLTTQITEYRASTYPHPFPPAHPRRRSQGLSRLHLLILSDNGVSPAAMEGLAVCMQQVKGLRLVTADSDDEQYADEYYNDPDFYDEDYENGDGFF